MSRTGRIVKIQADFYSVAADDAQEMIVCRARGLFKKLRVKPLVGDLVSFSEEPETGEGVVTEVRERLSELVRPPIANVDQVLVLFSAERPPFSDRALDRLLVHVERAKIDAAIGLTKLDATDDVGRWEEVLRPYGEMGYTVLLLSARTGRGMDALRAALRGNITVLAGPSGVGKSSLINALLPGSELQMGAVSERLGRGRHTTRHVELIAAGEGALIADTPGFSQLDWTGVAPAELSSLFRDISTLAADCRFRSCLHEEEPDCAVRAAALAGHISQKRYQNYRDFLLEVKEAWQRRY